MRVIVWFWNLVIVQTTWTDLWARYLMAGGGSLVSLNDREALIILMKLSRFPKELFQIYRLIWNENKRNNANYTVGEFIDQHLYAVVEDLDGTVPGNVLPLLHAKIMFWAIEKSTRLPQLLHDCPKYPNKRIRIGTDSMGQLFVPLMDKSTISFQSFRLSPNVFDDFAANRMRSFGYELQNRKNFYPNPKARFPYRHIPCLVHDGRLGGEKWADEKSVSVIIRIALLDTLIAMLPDMDRIDQYIHGKQSTQRPKAQSDYLVYTQMSGFIDQEVLKSLMRFLFRQPSIGERWIRTTSDFALHFRTIDHRRYAYVTPEYIADWYYMIIEFPMSNFLLPKRLWTIGKPRESVEEIILLRADSRNWEAVLRSKKRSLLETGYETY